MYKCQDLFAMDQLSQCRKVNQGGIYIEFKLVYVWFAFNNGSSITCIGIISPDSSESDLLITRLRVIFFPCMKTDFRPC